MSSYFEIFYFFILGVFYVASEEYRVPVGCNKNWETYVWNDREYLINRLPVSWEDANILCRGHHNGTLAILDSKEKAELIAEALAESQLLLDNVWVGARRENSDDPSGYKWLHGVELRRTALDIVSGDVKDFDNHFPMWVNRTRVPVPEEGADCVGLERVAHDNPVFLDLPCGLQRPFVCEREARASTKISELSTVRCRTGVYRIYDGRVDWNEATSHCIINNMRLANIATLKCLKKLGMRMLKQRPSIENAWIGARGSQGRWSWTDTGVDIFTPPMFTDAQPGDWPPMRQNSPIKPSGCLQLDHHATHPPIFLEARCERRMQFICYQSSTMLRTNTAPPSDDSYYYELVRHNYDWQHAYENCLKMNGTLATVDSTDIIIKLLLVMGENKEQPIDHIWIAGRLNGTRDPATETLSFSWYNPLTRKKIPTQSGDQFVAPWLDDDFSMDSACLNLDRHDHLKGVIYGLPCHTQQPSICMIDKAGGVNPVKVNPQPTASPVASEDNTEGV